jgi:epoxide hydrolase-like predicted phosphatase
MNSCKALVFDLGKVVFEYSWDLTFQYWAKASGKTFEEIKNNFVFDEVYTGFERNDVTPEEFREIISVRLGMDISDEQFDKGWCNLFMDVFPGMEELLSGLKNNYRLIALTNTNSIHATVWRTKYAGAVAHFEKIFSSHELHTRKPEPKAYTLVLDYLRTKPGETIFLDDLRENTATAASLGMKTITVKSTQQMKKELGQYLSGNP